jgi:endonuclease YncB( thermonuclease family)
MHRFMLFATLLIVLIGFAGRALPPYPPPPIVAEVKRVIDGDTIEVLLLKVPESLLHELQTGSIVRVRYIGVDAPETNEPGGPEATKLNTLLVAERTIYLEVEETLWDPYNRLLAYAYLDPTGYLMVNLTLIVTPIISTKTYPDTQRYAQIFECADKCLPQSMVIISVVLPNPSGPEPNNEWIELKNIGKQAVNISGWILSDGEGSYVVPEGTVLQPGETWRVYGYQYNPTGNKTELYLANSGDCVILYNSKGEETDRCCWTSARTDEPVTCH